MSASANQMVINVIWILFCIAVVFVVIFTIHVMKQRSKRRQRAKEKYNSFKEEYSHLTREKIDACKDEDLPGAVIMECERKEEEDENYLDHLNDVEKTIYGIYNINMCLSSSIGLRSFFITPSDEYYVEHIEEIFNNVHSPEIGKLMMAAKKLNDIMENDLEDADEDDEYARYNFSDFTQEYKGAITGTDFEKKVVRYIRENKDQFNDKEQEKKDETSR